MIIEVLKDETDLNSHGGKLCRKTYNSLKSMHAELIELEDPTILGSMCG